MAPLASAVHCVLMGAGTLRVTVCVSCVAVHFHGEGVRVVSRGAKMAQESPTVLIENLCTQCDHMVRIQLAQFWENGVKIVKYFDAFGLPSNFIKQPYFAKE